MNKNLAELGKNTRFSKTNQPPPGSRGKKSQLAQFIVDNDINKRDIMLVFQNLFFEKSKDQIRAMLREEKIPVLVWGMCTAFLADCKRGGFKVLRMILEFCYGKPDQKIQTDENIKITIKPAPKS